MTTYNTSTSAIPRRITADHYEMNSLAGKRSEKKYSLKFNYTTKKWGCTCYDYTEQGNHNCKHIRRLKEWIAEQKAAQEEKESAIRQAEAVAAAAERAAESEDQAECMLSLISRMPATTPDDGRFKAEMAIMEDAMIQNLKNIERIIEKQTAAINGLQNQIDYEHQLVSALQTQVCKHNEQFIVMEREIATLRQALADKEKRNHEAQQIIHQKIDEKVLHLQEQLEKLAQVEPVRLSAQQVVIDGPVKNSHSKIDYKKVAQQEFRQAQEPAEPAIKKLSEAKYEVEGFAVLVAKNGIVAGCYCPKGQSGRECEHGKLLEKFLSKSQQ